MQVGEGGNVGFLVKFFSLVLNLRFGKELFFGSEQRLSGYEEFGRHWKSIRNRDVDM